MADISVYLRAVLKAIYGKDVRQSIHDAIDAVNRSAEGSALVAQTEAIPGFYAVPFTRKR